MPSNPSSAPPIALQSGGRRPISTLPVVIGAGDELQGRRVDESWLLFFFVGLFSVSARRAAGVKCGNSLGPLTAAFLRIVTVGAFDVAPGTV